VKNRFQNLPFKLNLQRYSAADFDGWLAPQQEEEEEEAAKLYDARESPPSLAEEDSLASLASLRPVSAPVHYGQTVSGGGGDSAAAAAGRRRSEQHASAAAPPPPPPPWQSRYVSHLARGGGSAREPSRRLSLTASASAPSGLALKLLSAEASARALTAMGQQAHHVAMQQQASYGGPLHVESS
jgi:hypothetical protein